MLFLQRISNSRFGIHIGSASLKMSMKMEKMMILPISKFLPILLRKERRILSKGPCDRMIGSASIVQNFHSVILNTDPMFVSVPNAGGDEISKK